MPLTKPQDADYETSLPRGRPSIGNARTIKTMSNLWSAETGLPSFMGFPRSDCTDGPRPCPLVGCPYNNYLDVNPRTGHITLTHGDRAPEDVPPDESCSLDVADRGGLTLEEIANVLGLTRERIRQIELGAIKKIRKILGDDWLEQMKSE